MNVPPAVVERGSEMTDQEIIDAFVANGETEAAARVYLAGRDGTRPSVPGIPRFLD